MRRTRSTAAAWAAATVLLLGPAVAGCSTQIAVPEGRPSPPAQFESGAPETSGPAAERRAAVQEELDRVAADIEGDGDGQNMPGFAGLQVDVDAKAVDVYWVGQPPERVRRIVDAAPAGLTVTVRPATYDLKAMLAAVEKVFAAYGDELVSGSPNTEGTGITVEQTADKTEALSVADLSAVAGMPVTREIGELAEPAEG